MENKILSKAGLMKTKMIHELIDRIFKESVIKYKITEFETLGKSSYLSAFFQTKRGRDHLRAAPYFNKHPAISDNHVTIFRSPALDPVYLSFYLNSLAEQFQVEMHQRGTFAQLEPYPFDICKFLVWMAPDSFQKEIRKLYDQVAANEQQSKQSLDQAKTRVEQLIAEAA